MYVSPKERTPTYRAAIKAIRDLMETEGADKADRAFAEVMTEKKKEDFAKRHGVTRATGGICVRRLFGKRCTIGYPSDPFGTGHACLPPGSDHISLWNKDGKASLLVSQPYGLAYRTLKEIMAYCEKYGLEVRIDANPCWHFPGQVIGVIFQKAKP